MRTTGVCLYLLGVLLLLHPADRATARGWIVAQDGSGDFTRVTDAITTASGGDSILIRPGSYDEVQGEEEVLRITQKPLALIGLGATPDETALRITRLLFDESIGVLCENILFHDGDRGVPLRCLNGSLTIRRCVFARNGSALSGYGGAVSSMLGPLTIDDSVFTGNQALLYEESSLMGGGAVWTNGPTEIRNCVFTENAAAGNGGAVFGNDDVLIEHCLFMRNSARGGAAVYLGTNPRIRWCTFLSNEVVGGAGAEAWSDIWNIHPSHCIIAKTVNGWALECNYGKTVECCDLWMNEKGDTMGMWCDVGEDLGNFSADPMFCDEAAGDLRLQEGSPCLPGQHGPVECDVVGAYGLGCTVGVVSRRSWGQLRQLFR